MPGPVRPRATNGAHMRKVDYRSQALKILPWVCGKCGREFAGKNLRELTVHHIDHNYKNNPPDGSNWELLCLYCHDNEHSRELEADAARATGLGNNQKQAANHATAQPFANLKALLNKGKSQ